MLFFFFFAFVTGPRRSLSLKLSDTRVCAPQIRACFGTTAYFCVMGLCNQGRTLDSFNLVRHSAERYRDTSLIRNSAPLGRPYSRPMP